MKKLLLILSLCFFALGITACSGGQGNGCGKNDDVNAYFISEDLTLQVGDSYKVEYVGEDLQIKSVDTEIAKVSVTNVVTALKEGETKIQLVSGDSVLDELKLEVVESSYKPSEEQTATSNYRISLSVTEKRIFPGGDFKLTAKVYKNNTVCDDVVTWNYGGSDNPIISATSNGNQLTVRGVGYGKTTVTAIIGEFAAVCKVTVADINYQVLSAPELSNLTESEISWEAVEHADSYSVSVNNGISWKEVQDTSYNYGEANPLNIRIVAVGNGINYEDSEESRLTQQNVKFSCGDRLLFYTNKTVSGEDNTDKTSSVAIEVYASVNGGEDIKIQDQQFSIPNSNVVSMNGNVFTSVNEGDVDISLVGVNDIVLKAVVGTPIKTRADLDALGFAYKNSTHKELWSAGNVYLLANDIDYATDTTTFGNFRMDDGNGKQDLWDRYLIPIAARHDDASVTTTLNGAKKSVHEWGIFGKISGDTSGDHTFFYGTIDGDGHAINNAVIPYGVSFVYEPTESGVNSNHGSNFIGALVYGGQLRNIAFTGLEFEDPVQIGEAAKSETPNPYYTDKNENLADSTLKANGYITQTSMSGTFGHKYFNSSNRTGVVGLMQNGIISNVYVEAVMKNGTFSTRAVNGLIVAFIDVDSYVNGSLNGGIKGKVENCIVETSYYDKAEWLGWLVDYTGTQTIWTTSHDYNSGMGAVIGTSFLEDEAAISNCFAIGDLKTWTSADGSDKTSVETIFSPGTALRHSLSKGLDKSINCGVYKTLAELQSAQENVLNNISIASYLVK